MEEPEIFTQSNRRAPRTVLLRGARQLVTLRGEHRPRQGGEMRNLGIIQDGALLMVDGIIREVGPSRRVERLAEARNAIEIDASGKVVLPGFLDCLAGPLHPVATPDEIEARCRDGAMPAAAEPKRTTPLKLAADSGRRLRQFAQQGTLTLAASNAIGDDGRNSLKTLRAIRDASAGPVSLVPVLAVGEASGAELLERAWQEQLARLATIHVNGCLAQARELAQHARKLGFGLRVRGDARLAAEMGAFLILDGGPLTPETSAALRDAGTVSASCPAADLMAGIRGAPVRAWIDDGLAVALATGFGMDGCPVNSLPAVCSLACLTLGLSPAEAIMAITINAAFALNVAHRTGSLTPGKSADFVLLDAADYRELAARLGSNLIHSSVLRGKWTVAGPPAAQAS